MSHFNHQAVLLKEALESLNIHPSGIYIDATFGRGGHSRAILQQLNEDGLLIAFDQDPEAVAFAKQQFADEPRLKIEHCNFNQVADVIEQYGLTGKIDGVLMDLGVSSPQLDEAERGFSFQSDGPLDMRMDPTTGSSAADWLANVKERELRKVLFEFGEERFAVRIAKAIVAARALQPIRRTAELAKIVSEAVPSRGQRRHPVTKTFQAIRIRINDELQQLEQALEQMDPTDQEVLALRHFEELTNTEVSEVLGIQQKAASIRYVRAIARLKEVLAKVPGFFDGIQSTS